MPSFAKGREEFDADPVNPCSNEAGEQYFIGRREPEILFFGCNCVHHIVCSNKIDLLIFNFTNWKINEIKVLHNKHR